MPLRATIDGQEIIAPLLDDAAWEALRARVSAEGLRVTLPCCQVEGYLRRSRYGTKHFAHKTDAERVCLTAKGETLEHLRAKADILLACHAAGFEALTESAGEGWRADVLARRGAARIAFEVQWSFLRLNDLLYRQERYRLDGVRGCWFFRRPPPSLYRPDDGGPELVARRDLPLFHLYVNADRSFDIALNRRLYALQDFVERLLNGGVRYVETARSGGVKRLRAAFFEIDCPHCGQRTDVYAVEPAQTADCGVRFTPDQHWYSVHYAFHPQLLEALAQYRASERGSRVRLGSIRTRYSVRDGRAYVSFGCYWCDGMIEREHLDLALMGTRPPYEDPAAFEVSVRLYEEVRGHLPHWCAPDDGRFCGG